MMAAKPRWYRIVTFALAGAIYGIKRLIASFSRPGLSEWLAQLTTLATIVLRLFRTDDQPLRAHAD